MTEKKENQFDFSNEKAVYFPPYLMFDVVGVCNLECIHCPQKLIRHNQNSKSLYLDFEIFKKVIDEAKEFDLDFIRITANGEPLLHPEIMEMIGYAERHVNVPVALTTNGNLLGNRIAEKLIELKLDVIDISMDAFTKEVYEKIRKKGDFFKLMAHVNNLLYLKRKMASPIKIILSFVEQDLNRHEVNAFKKYWETMVDEVLIRPQHTMGGGVLVSISSNGTKRYPCPHLWKRIVVDHSGRLSYCPVDMFSRTLIGDFPKSPITKIWSGEEYTKLRNAHLENDLTRYPHCEKCTDWMTTPWARGYDVLIKRVSGK